MRVNNFVECGAVCIGSHSRLVVGGVPRDCGFLGDGGLGDGGLGGGGGQGGGGLGDGGLGDGGLGSGLGRLGGGASSYYFREASTSWGIVRR